MITQVVIDFFVDTFTFLFTLMPNVEKLPTIGGYDIDAVLSSGMGGVYTIFNEIWPLGIMFTGFLFIMGYYIIKLGGKVIFGNRWPLS